MLQNKGLKGKLIRWALKLQEYDYTVHYRPGVCNVPDALSRSTVNVIDYDTNICYYPDCKGDPAGKVNWIQCDGCDRWYHWSCLGLRKREVDAMDDFNCSECSSSIPQTQGKPSSSRGRVVKAYVQILCSLFCELKTWSPHVLKEGRAGNACVQTAAHVYGCTV